jgi:hypothetical protein
MSRNHMIVGAVVIATVAVVFGAGSAVGVGALFLVACAAMMGLMMWMMMGGRRGDRDDR